MSGVPVPVGNAPSPAYTHAPPAAASEKPHPFDTLNALLRAAGLPEAEPRPWLPAGPAEQEQVSGWCQAQGSGTDGSPCFTPGAALVQRASAGLITSHWPPLRVVWIGAGEDRVLNRALAQEAGIDASDAFSVRGLAELGRRARFAVTNDSGPMHVLSCAGIPLYAFFGPTSVAQSHALGQRQRVLVHPVPCSPCRSRSAPAAPMR